MWSSLIFAFPSGASSRKETKYGVKIDASKYACKTTFWEEVPACEHFPLFEPLCGAYS